MALLRRLTARGEEAGDIDLLEECLFAIGSTEELFHRGRHAIPKWGSGQSKSVEMGHGVARIESKTPSIR